MKTVGFDEGEAKLDWIGLTDALIAGHKLSRADMGDMFLYRTPDTGLVRGAVIDGLGFLVKTATIFPENTAKELPTVNGSVLLFDDAAGLPEAMIDFHLVTKWKTAGDSLLGARLLARPDSRKITILGAGTQGANLWSAYRALFPDAEFTIWNRTFHKAEAFAKTYANTRAESDLETAIRGADIITSATMSSEPMIKGAWLSAGQHLDLIGAYRPDMREADDEALTRARIFVDSRDTTIDHIGELKDPIARGVIKPQDIVADFYDLGSDSFSRQNNDEITLFKNGGGAHLDLMTSRYILNQWSS
ncbi:ornithine cyclodeaminase family protein [Falsihalocynthiibacter sp. SS001]|uniref:ornithine cyclodeaminase family protein n=1 Tax=Falsihalocynthiibacter sp. SS001 TaxID=3349698 RepID=UPI0036D2BAB3